MALPSLRRYVGDVIKETVAVGSKSEHAAVVLLLPSGKKFRLRRLAGEAFHDPELDLLVGKSLSCRGRVYHGTTLIMESWDIQDRVSDQGCRAT